MLPTVSLCSRFEVVSFPLDWDRACHEGGSKPSTPTNRLRALLAADRTGESQPSSKATTMLLATSGCLWWIMARESAQLAQKAESWVRTGAAQPQPSQNKGSVAASVAAGSHCPGWTPRMVLKHRHKPWSRPSANLCTISGLTNRKRYVARAFAQCNRRAQADCTSESVGIRSNRVSWD